MKISSFPLYGIIILIFTWLDLNLYSIIFLEVTYEKLDEILPEISIRKVSDRI